MTNKEQIIIDGVNVYGCVQFIQEEEDCCNLGGSCKGWPNCYFKQLARKTQECEELKKELNGSEKWRINAESLNEKLDIKNTRYRKALEEIEKILKDEICEECSVKEGCKAGCKEHQCLDIINKAKDGKNDNSININ